MTDMRRTILWVVFTMSLVLLWDAWNKHNGQAGFFGVKPPVAAPATAAAGSAPALAGAVPAAAVVPGALPASAAAPTAPVAAAAAPKSEQVTLTTDRVKATFDTQGGSLVKLELLDFRDPVDATKNVVLMDQSAKRFYAAQSGLVTGQAGVTLPNHFTLMNLVPGVRTLAQGAADVSIRFESSVVDGVKLAKTYTLKRGDYTITVKHEVINQGAVAVSPQLYLQLARDGNPPEGESSFYFTFTGPAVYTDTKKFQKVDFKDIAK
ncbi:MAG: hypothetical protein RI907_152, partial [Pseudomonadota bacterium]